MRRPQGRPRPHTETPTESRSELYADRHELISDLNTRPKTRGECKDGPRPCPWVGCRHHLALEVTPAGRVQHVHPGVDLEDLEHTCSLDVADDRPQSLHEIGRLLNMSRERVRQIEARLLGELAMGDA